MLVERFVRQETVGSRGKSTCYATSIVNAAIGLGAVSLELTPIPYKPLTCNC